MEQKSQWIAPPRSRCKFTKLGHREPVDFAHGQCITLWPIRIYPHALPIPEYHERLPCSICRDETCSREGIVRLVLLQRGNTHWRGKQDEQSVAGHRRRRHSVYCYGTWPRPQNQKIFSGCFFLLQTPAYVGVFPLRMKKGIFSFCVKTAKRASIQSNRCRVHKAKPAINRHWNGALPYFSSVSQISLEGQASPSLARV